MTRDRVFVSYSHDDADWFDRFGTFLKSIGGGVWSDRDIEVGDSWFDEIRAAIDDTKVAVLLVTQNFFASDFITKNELAPFLAARDAGELTLVWVAVGYSVYQGTPLEDIQSFNDPQRPLESLSEPEQNAELVRLVYEVHKLIEPAEG